MPHVVKQEMVGTLENSGKGALVSHETIFSIVHLHLEGPAGIMHTEYCFAFKTFCVFYTRVEPILRNQF